MRLIEWMRREGIDDKALAKMVGDCTHHAVKKWKYGERLPPLDRAIRIQEVTKRRVTIHDLVDEVFA